MLGVARRSCARGHQSLVGAAAAWSGPQPSRCSLARRPLHLQALAATEDGRRQARGVCGGQPQKPARQRLLEDLEDDVLGAVVERVGRQCDELEAACKRLSELEGICRCEMECVLLAAGHFPGRRQSCRTRLGASGPALSRIPCAHPGGGLLTPLASRGRLLGARGDQGAHVGA